MELRTENNIIIADSYFIDKYSCKVPRFTQGSSETLGGKTASWRFGIDYDVSFIVRTESKDLYDTLIDYHNKGTYFRLNETKDLGNLMLKTRAGKCTFKRMDIRGIIFYEINLTCEIIEEGIEDEVSS